MAFRLGDDETVYTMPLASSLPMSELLALSDAAAKGGPDILRAQLEMLRKYIGEQADALTAAEVADIFGAWNEESAEDGASASE